MGYGTFLSHLQKEAQRRNQPFSAIAAEAKALGIDRVTEDADTLPDALPLLEETGLKVNIVYCISRLVQGEELNKNLKAAELTARAGGSILMMVPGFYENGLTDEEALRNATGPMREIVRTCEGLGIHAAIEDYGGLYTPYSTVKQVVRMLDAVEGLQFVYDSGNILYHKEDPLALWDATQDRIVGIHAKDLSCVPEEGGKTVLTPAGEILCPTAFGKGLLPGEELRRRIRAKNILAERITFEHDGNGAPDSLAFLRRSVAFLEG